MDTTGAEQGSTTAGVSGVKLVELIESQAMVFHAPSRAEYDIELSRIENAEDVLRWADHMAQKTWVTKDHLSQFVLLCSRHLNINLDPRP